MASQAALYVHVIAMLNERAEAVAHELAASPDNVALRQEQIALARSLTVFRARLRRTERRSRWGRASAARGLQRGAASAGFRQGDGVVPDRRSRRSCSTTASRHSRPPSRRIQHRA